MDFLDIKKRIKAGVDLSQLPPPDIIQPLSFEEIRDAIRDDFMDVMKSEEPKFVLYPSDPASKLIDVVAYNILRMRAQINEAARQCMVAYATGTNLDNLAIFYGEELVRKKGETDNEFRQRIVYEHDSFSTAGAFNGWVTHARKAVKYNAILDVYPYSPTGKGDVSVIILFKDTYLDEDGKEQQTGPMKASFLKQIQDRLTSKDIKPVTDVVTVSEAKNKVIEFKAKVYIQMGMDKAIVRENIVKSFQNYIDDRRAVYAQVPMSGLHAALFVSNVQKVEITFLKYGGETIDVSDGKIHNIVVGKDEAPLFVFDPNDEKQIVFEDIQ